MKLSADQEMALRLCEVFRNKFPSPTAATNPTDQPDEGQQTMSHAKGIKLKISVAPTDEPGVNFYDRATGAAVGELVREEVNGEMRWIADLRLQTVLNDSLEMVR